MPEDFRPRIKNPKNSNLNVNAKSQIDNNNPTETKEPTKKKKIMCFGIFCLTLVVIPAACVPIVSAQKKNVDNISVAIKNVTVNNLKVNNVTVNNVEVKHKGFAQKKIIKDGKEYFVMTIKQVKMIAQKLAIILNSLADRKHEKKKVTS